MFIFMPFITFRNGKVLLQYSNLRVVAGRKLVVVGILEKNNREKSHK